MDPNDLQRKIAKASSEGKLPFYVSVTAGTTVLGAFDRIPEISAICRKTRLWLHVDVRVLFFPCVGVFSCHTNKNFIYAA